MENDNENPDYKQYPLNTFVWLTSHKKEKGRSPKFLPKFSGPHQIVEVIPPSNYRLKTPSGKLLKCPIHHSRLKLHNGDKPAPPKQNTEVRKCSRKMVLGDPMELTFFVRNY